MDVPPGFVRPNLLAPIDLDAIKRALPKDGAIKGMFAQGLVDKMKGLGLAPAVRSSWVGFKDYPLDEYLDFLLDAAAKIHPGTPPREAVRRLGHDAYLTLAKSLAGRVVFGVLGKDIHAISRIVPKAYQIAGKVSRATMIELGESSSLVRLEDVTLVDCYQVGAFEGVLDVCGMEGEVYVKLLSPCSAELFTTWRPKQ